MLVQAILIGLIAMFVTFEWMFGTNLQECLLDWLWVI